MSMNMRSKAIAGMIVGLLVSTVVFAEQHNPVQPNIYSGYYSRHDNFGKQAQASGYSHYIKFYPKNRVIRLYIPFPYSEEVKPESIEMAFDNAHHKTSGSAYIRNKFGALQQAATAHLDTFRWVDGQVMYDCGNAAPCRVTFKGNVMTIIQPGVVLDHKIDYDLVDSH